MSPTTAVLSLAMAVLALSSLQSAVALPVNSKIVQSLQCSSSPIATGQFSAQGNSGNATTLALSSTKDDEGHQNLVNANSSQPLNVEFYACNATILGYNDVNGDGQQKRYGTIRVQGQDSTCVIGQDGPDGSSTFIASDCSTSDDSSQFFQFFSIESASDSSSSSSSSSNSHPQPSSRADSQQLSTVRYVRHAKEDVTAANQFRYAITAHNELVALQTGEDNSFLEIGS